jgi:hypothetical protein
MNKRFLLVFFILIIFGSTILFSSSSVGLADNSDFYRITKPNGMNNHVNNKYFHFYDSFEYICRRGLL